MGERSERLRLSDIVEAIELINSEMTGVSLEAFESDRRKRWLVERGIEMMTTFGGGIGAFDGVLGTLRRRLELAKQI